ncbi:hypothetical protein EG329_009940 [Mollisiaceae sp. DMI_Dod_QoI]|nr:hypothetical protein EG329_009940 [Helotiales sp. DMI_Dod_QoI]
MSARSAPSASISNADDSIEKRAASPMLDRYLADPQTLTEKLALPQPSKNTTTMIREKRKEAKEFLCKWQTSWGKRE